MVKNKVLVIRFSSIGDIVLTSPVVRCLKKQLPDAEIHFCTKEKFKSLVDSNPYLDKIHLLGDDLSKLINELKKEQFDFIVDLHNNLRTRIIKLKLGRPSRSFEKLNLEKWLLVNFKINRLPHVHIVDRYMETLLPLGIDNDKEGLDYFIPEEDEIKMAQLPEEFRSGYVVYAIGGNHNTKKLPLERMIELCEKINKPVILLGGKEDFENGENIQKAFNTFSNQAYNRINKGTVIFNGTGKFNLNQSASLIKNSRIVFTHDTGLMHIAAAFKKKIYSIWGNTTPLFGMYPYQTEYTVFENNQISCRPCSKIGYEKCPKGHFKCMNDLVFNFPALY